MTLEQQYGNLCAQDGAISRTLRALTKQKEALVVAIDDVGRQLDALAAANAQAKSAPAPVLADAGA